MLKIEHLDIGYVIERPGAWGGWIQEALAGKAEVACRVLAWLGYRPYTVEAVRELLKAAKRYKSRMAND